MTTRQVINLYAQLEPPKAKPVSTIMMLGVCGVVFFSYVVVAVYLAITGGQLEAQVVAQTQLNRQLQQQIERKKAEDELVDLTRFENELTRLRTEQQRHAALLQLIRDSAISGQGDFSEAMAALARQHIAGIAIERFSLSNVATASRGSQFSMSGELGSPEVLPRYVKKLGGERPFSDLTFNRVQLKTVDGALTFEMSSRTGGDDVEDQGS